MQLEVSLAAQAVPALETLLDGMEHGDDVAVVLDQALAPLLSTLGSGPAEVRQPSLWMWQYLR